MARQVRIEFEGAFYHVIARGNERRPIVRDDADRHLFLKILAASLDGAGARLHAYCLMDNHYHLLVETPLANLSAFVRRLNHVYALAFNRRHRRVGHLFQGRYKAILVERGSYLAEAARYIHMNPVLTKSAARRPPSERLRMMRAYPWSSLPGYLDQKVCPPYLTRAAVFQESGMPNEDGREYWKWLTADLARGVSAENVEETAVGGVALGSDAFVDEVARRLAGVERRERPAIRLITAHAARDRVVGAVERVTGLDVPRLKRDAGWRRRFLVECLAHHAGMRNVEIARWLGFSESTISQDRRRLARRDEASEEIAAAFRGLEARLKSTE